MNMENTLSDMDLIDITGGKAFVEDPYCHYEPLVPHKGGPHAVYPEYGVIYVCDR